MSSETRVISGKSASVSFEGDENESALDCVPEHLDAAAQFGLHQQAALCPLVKGVA